MFVAPSQLRLLPSVPLVRCRRLPSNGKGEHMRSSLRCWHLSSAGPVKNMKSKSDGGLPDCPGTLGDLQLDLGFKAGNSGAHSARTMMLADLTALLSSAPAHAKRDAFNKAIVEDNCLGKKTTSNRWLTARHLADLYGLDEGVTVFRLLRFFWNADTSARPMLALLCANARDTLLRRSANKVLEMKPGETVTSADFVAFFNHELPSRFSEAMTLSLAQNVGATWTQAGYFIGKITKARTRPVVTPAVTAYALCLGYLCGLRGQVLLESFWARLLDINRDQVAALAQEAAKRSWLDFKGAGNVYEINFRQLLTPKEIQTSHGPD